MRHRPSDVDLKDTASESLRNDGKHLHRCQKCLAYIPVDSSTDTFWRAPWSADDGSRIVISRFRRRYDAIQACSQSRNGRTNRPLRRWRPRLVLLLLPWLLVNRGGRGRAVWLGGRRTTEERNPLVLGNGESPSNIRRVKCDGLGGIDIELDERVHRAVEPFGFEFGDGM